METHTRKRPCDEVGRDWSDAAANQQTPRITESHQKSGRGKDSS